MSKMPQIMMQHAPAYREKFGNSMPENHKRVIHAISNCRQGYYGYSDHICEECQNRELLLNCCGNRHCPSCQTDKNKHWLAKQMDKLLQTDYFMITFTIPQELRSLVRSNQEVCYNVFFKATSETLITLTADDKYIGCDTPGFFGVLHTWGRQLPYHPHIHYIAPAGGIKDDKWLPSSPKFYVSNHAASKMFRGKFIALLKEAGLGDRIPQAVWEKDWVVNTEPVGDGSSSLQYLAPYVHRVALTDSRIKSYDESQVTFNYKKGKSRRLRSLKLAPEEFLRRFLQHTLPSGFMKIRYYGFMHPNSRYKPQDVRDMISVQQAIIQAISEEKAGDKIRKTIKHYCCKFCEGPMLMLEFNHKPHYKSESKQVAGAEERLR